MKFVKLFAAGQDYIFLSGDNAFDIIENIDVRRLCDRKKGIGADGIAAIRQNSAKMSQITGFCQNGEIMRDFSTASICAAFMLLSEKSITTQAFQSKNGEIFTVSDGFSDKDVTVTCDFGRGEFELKYPAIQRKTQLGNRILTLTAVELHGIHTVHFSECKDNLNLTYLGEQVTNCSLFQKQADLIIAQKNKESCFDMNYYENKTGYSYPALSCFASMALAACKTKNARYDEEIKISCNGYAAYVICKENGDSAVQCSVQKIYEGSL